MSRPCGNRIPGPAPLYCRLEGGHSCGCLPGGRPPQVAIRAPRFRDVRPHSELDAVVLETCQRLGRWVMADEVAAEIATQDENFRPMRTIVRRTVLPRLAAAGKMMRRVGGYYKPVEGA